MDADSIKWFASLGVGGVLAAFIFFFYRKDLKSYADMWQAQTTMSIGVMRETTLALAELRAAVSALHRRLDDNHIAQTKRNDRE